MKTTTSEPEQLTLRASDGYPLIALCYPATAPLRGHLVMAGATGVPQLCLVATPLACCPTTRAWPASTPLPPAPAGTAGCPRLSSGRYC